MVKFFKLIWQKLGASEKARRRNASIVFAIVAAILVIGFYTGAIKFSFSFSREVQAAAPPFPPAASEAIKQ